MVRFRAGRNRDHDPIGTREAAIPHLSEENEERKRILARWAGTSLRLALAGVALTAGLGFAIQRSLLPASAAVSWCLLVLAIATGALLFASWGLWLGSRSVERNVTTYSPTPLMKRGYIKIEPRLDEHEENAPPGPPA